MKIWTYTHQNYLQKIKSIFAITTYSVGGNPSQFRTKFTRDFNRNDGRYKFYTSKLVI